MKSLPKYRHYKPKDLAVVRIDGRDHYLGKYDSPESHERYHRLIAEWLAAGRTSPPRHDDGTASAGPTIHTLVLAYWRHAELHYRGPDGQPTQELENMRAAIRPLRQLYGSTLASDFGPKALRAIRQKMMSSGLCRTTVNARINRIRRVFRWAVGVEMVPPSVYQALQAVPGLQQGRTDAREPEGVKPVALDRVEATLPHLNRVVAAMVRVQLLTGCRTAEVMVMRGCDLKPGEPNWEYRPARHKTAWRGKDRVVIIGPKAQEILKTFLKADPHAYLFSPRDVVEAHHAERSRRRKSKPTPSEVAKRAQHRPGRGHADRYDRRSYRQAVVRACDRAFPHPELSGISPKELTADQRRELKEWRRQQSWSPLQLRHTTATTIRSRYGLEASQVVLGHARCDTTQIYAERDLARAHAVMAEIG
jgi:site-specific recombinase XerD